MIPFTQSWFQATNYDPTPPTLSVLPQSWYQATIHNHTNPTLTLLPQSWPHSPNHDSRLPFITTLTQSGLQWNNHHSIHFNYTIKQQGTLRQLSLVYPCIWKTLISEVLISGLYCNKFLYFIGLEISSTAQRNWPPSTQEETSTLTPWWDTMPLRHSQFITGELTKCKLKHSAETI